MSRGRSIPGPDSVRALQLYVQMQSSGVIATTPPTGSRHPRAKDDDRARARELRITGMTYAAIAAALGVSKSSVSLWVRDLPRPSRETAAQARSASRSYWEQETRRRESSRRQTKLAAAQEVATLTARELFLVGSALYWAEGSKDKPYRRQERVVFTNSDEQMIRVFVAWLRLLAVPPEHLRYRVAIHETADVEGAVRYCADVVGVQPSTLLRPTIKRHKAKPGRRNVGDSYHGCLVIRVLQSAVLYQQIDGWWQGIARGALNIPQLEPVADDSLDAL